MASSMAPTPPTHQENPPSDVAVSEEAVKVEKDHGVKNENWRVKEDDIEVRKKIARAISKHPTEWKPNDIARRLEHHLYNSAPSKAAYSDLATLKNRLQQVLQVTREMQAQRQQNQSQKQRPRSNSNSSSVLDEIEREADALESKPVFSVPSAQISATQNTSSTRVIEEKVMAKHQKLLQLQQRLKMLKHARLCTLDSCATPLCSTFKQILEHVAGCKNESCGVSGCKMAKQLLAHYKMCRNFQCELCNSIRKPMDVNQQQEVLRRQQERLCLLRHASICSSKGNKNCKIPHCAEMRVLWTHICSCSDRHCKFNHCVSSRYVLSHFKECRNASCEVCMPVRNAIHSVETAKKEKAAETNLKKRPLIETTLPPAKTAKKSENKKPPKTKYVIETRKPLSSLNKKSKTQSSSPAASESSAPVSVTASPIPVNSVNNIKDISYLDSMGIEEIDAHVQSLRFSFAGHLNDSQLKNKLLPLLKKLMDHQFGWVFSSPVDPVALNIPDYFDIIKCPMDLGTIKKRIDSGYYPSIEAFSADVRLCFENCIAYNDESNEFNILAKDLLRLFEIDFENLKEEINKELEARFAQKRDEMCQLCGGESFKFAPSMLFCNGVCRGRIRRHTHYFSDEKNNYHWCANCYKDMKDEDLLECGEKKIQKKDLIKQKNSEVVEEPWVECDFCKRWYHQICALFNERNNTISGEEDSFHCPNCVKELRIHKKVNPSTTGLKACRLTKTRLSQVIEDRVVNALAVEIKEEERRIGKPLDTAGLNGEGISIREVLSVEKVVEIKERMKKLFSKSIKYKSNLPQFSYRLRCFCVFQKIEGVDVLLFTLYIQEYGEHSTPENQRRIYIAYLDSVSYFQPRKFRTLMHQEVLIGCLYDARRRGFYTAHIWSCPPLKGDDYIFFCKPENQKIPKAARLTQWYNKLLRKARREGVVYKISNLYDEYYLKGKTAIELPYFDGDYWPGLAEELIKQMEEASKNKSKTKPKIEKEKEKAKEKMKKSKTQKKGNKKNTSSNVSGKEMEEYVNPDPLMQKLKDILEPQKDDFFVVSLYPICHHCQKNIVTGTLWTLEPEPSSTTKDSAAVTSSSKGKGSDFLDKVDEQIWKETIYYCDTCYIKNKSSIQRLMVEKQNESESEKKFTLSSQGLSELTMGTDHDDLMACEIFDSRESFLTYCQGNHCQFDQLRRAKHSSMMVLYHLFNQGTAGFTYKCFICEKELSSGNRWQCSICPNFNLCDGCKANNKHEHTLHIIPVVSVQTKTSGTGKKGKQRPQLDPALLELIEHASACQKVECTQNCHRMRGLLKHGATCKTKISGKCQTCRRILSLLKVHGQLCTKNECPVPRCKDIREHLARIRFEQMQLQSRRQNTLIDAANRQKYNPENDRIGSIES